MLVHISSELRTSEQYICSNMAYRSKQLQNVNSNFNKTGANNYQKKFEQMSKQQQIIEQKKLEIQQKLEEKKRKETADALKKLQDDKPKEADLGKRGFGSFHSRHQSWRGNDRWRRPPQREEEKLPSAMPTNIFSNDGSFLDQFRKLSGINVLTKIHRLDNPTKIEENEVLSERVEDFTSGDFPDKDVLKKERRWSSPTRDRSRSPPKIFTPQQMPPIMYPQPPMGMPSMLMQPQHPVVMNYQQTFNPMQFNQAPPIIPSSIPPPAPLNPVTIPSPSPLQPYSIPPPLPIMPHSIPQPSPMIPHSIPQPSPMIPHSIPPPLPLIPHSIPPPMNQPPALFLTAPPPPPPLEPQPLTTISIEQSETDVVSSVTPEPPFEEEEIKEATIWDEEKSLESVLQDAAPPEECSSGDEEEQQHVKQEMVEKEDDYYSGGEMFTVTPPPQDYWQEIERESEIKPNMDIPPPPSQETEIKLEIPESQVNFEDKDSEYIFTGDNSTSNDDVMPPVKKKRRSRWADPSNEHIDGEPMVPIDLPPVAPIVGPVGIVVPTALGAVNNIVPVSAIPTMSPLPTTTPVINVPGMSGPMISMVSRTEPGLLQYAVNAYGRSNLTEDEWKTAEDHYKINLLYQDMMRKKEELKRLEAAGKNKYEYDSDEEVDGGTWEHKWREKEMEATQRWAEELTEKAKGKHHIGDFLPPDELARFMEKYEALKQGRPPDLSDYKEYKLKEDNIGFQMLQKLGWTEGQGLGSNGSGILDPVNKATVRTDNQGLGMERPDDVSQGDDEYDAYRKRMMLAYRFRPNPMNNPRRPYY